MTAPGLKDPGCVSILFLGGAKRVAMARLFRRACEARGLACRITGYELDSHSALALEGEIVEGLRWSSPDIYADLDDVVAQRGIDLMLPFVDSAVGIVAEYCRRPDCTPVFAPVSERDVAEAMFDKVTAAERFERAGLAIPRTYRSGDAPCRLIAKPRFGSASKGIEAIDTASKLYEILSQADRYLIQERIDHREELTVDCYVGMRSGQIAAVSPRLRCEVSGGEVVRTETVADADADALTRRALVALRLRGAVTVQLIRDLDSGRLMIMEINPRLGGGAVASVYAGADIPALIIDDLLGEKLPTMTATPGVETVRYLADHVFYPDK